MDELPGIEMAGFSTRSVKAVVPFREPRKWKALDGPRHPWMETIAREGARHIGIRIIRCIVPLRELRYDMRYGLRRSGK
jgi:hypothetical protein